MFLLDLRWLWQITHLGHHSLHLKGEKVFGYAKQPINYPPDINNDSHHLDDVNFSHP
jgi:hypothetical protein